MPPLENLEVEHDELIEDIQCLQYRLTLPAFLSEQAEIKRLIRAKKRKLSVLKVQITAKKRALWASCGLTY